MRTQLLVLLSVSLFLLNSCAPLPNEGSQTEQAEVKLQLQHRTTTLGSARTGTETRATEFIVVVDGETLFAAAGPADDVVQASGLLDVTTNQLSLTLPLDTSIRLFAYRYAEALTLTELQTRLANQTLDTDAIDYGKTEPFSIAADSSTQSLNITVLLQREAVFLDAAVEGLQAETVDGAQTTDADGMFVYFPDETVSFSVGGIELGSQTNPTVVTPYSLLNVTEGQSADSVTNLVRLLLTLDDDGDANNGIQLSSGVISNTASASVNFNQSTAAFASSLAASISNWTAGNQVPQTALVDEELALEHLTLLLERKNTALSVETVVPVASSTEVPLDTLLVAAFNEPLRASSVANASALTLTSAGGATVSGTLTTQNSQLIFTPASLLSPNTVYSAQLSSELQDQEGSALGAPFSWSFTTGTSSGGGFPNSSSTSPDNGSTDVVLDIVLAAYFDGVILPEGDELWSVQDSDGNVISCESGYTIVAVYCVPTENLAANTTYTASVLPNLRSQSGIAMSEAYSFSFTTGESLSTTGTYLTHVGSFQDNYTREPEVHLIVSGDRNADELRYVLTESESAPSSSALDWQEPLGYPVQVPFALSAGEAGRRTVTAWFDNTNTVVNSVSAEVVFDDVSPTGTLAFAVPTTNADNISVTVSGNDALSPIGWYYLSRDNTTALLRDAEQWIPVDTPSLTTEFAVERSLDNSTEGTITLYGWLLDYAGNISESFGDSFLFDTTAPSLSGFTIAGSASFTNNDEINVSFTASDNLSGIAYYSLSEDNATPAVTSEVWLPYAGDNLSYAFVDNTTEELKTVYLFLQDNASNIVSTSASVIYDITSPTVTAITPLDNTTGLFADDLTLTVNFSEPVATTSLTAETDCSGSVQLYAEDDNASACVPLTFSFSADNQTVTLTPNLYPEQNVERGTRYQLVLTDDITDRALNPLERFETVGGLLTASFSGQGTAESPFLLNYPEQIVELSATSAPLYPKSYIFQLTRDIDLTTLDDNLSADLRPIGDNTTAFSGVLEGDNYTIRGFGLSTYAPSGLFGRLSNARVSNLTIVLDNTTGLESSGFVGGLAGIADNVTIENVQVRDGFVRNSQTLSADYNPDTVNLEWGAGGLVGKLSRSTVTNSHAIIPSVHSDLLAGGLVGHMEHSHLDNVSAIISDNVSGNLAVGGLVGALTDNSTIRYATANVDNVSGDLAVGGLVGVAERSALIEQSAAEANVTATGKVDTWSSESTGQLIAAGGGLVGYLDNVTLRNSSALGAVSGGGSGVGGLVGLAQHSQLDNVSALVGDVRGTDEVGGLVGALTDNSTIRYANANVDNVSGNLAVGGLVGLAQHSQLDNVSALVGDVRGTDEVGGLVGALTDNSTIHYASANVDNVSGNLAVGGLVGVADRSSLIEQSAAEANVTATGKEETSSSEGTLQLIAAGGGLVGHLDNATLRNSYALGAVSGGGNGLGGLVGEAWLARIESNYTSTTLSSTSGARVDPLVGSNRGGSVHKNYWDNTTNPVAFGTGGWGRPLAQLQQSAAPGACPASGLPSFAGWDHTVWDFDNASALPKLRWQTGSTSTTGFQVSCVLPANDSTVGPYEKVQVWFSQAVDNSSTSGFSLAKGTDNTTSFTVYDNTTFTLSLVPLGPADNGSYTVTVPSSLTSLSGVTLGSASSQSYSVDAALSPAVEATTGLLGHYSFNDSAALGREVTERGQSLAFPDNSSYLSVDRLGSDSSVYPRGSLSISGAVRQQAQVKQEPDAITDNASIVLWIHPDTPPSADNTSAVVTVGKWDLIFEANGSVAWKNRLESSISFARNPVRSHAWTQVALSCTDNLCDLYFDGQAQGTDNWTAPAESTYDNTTLALDWNLKSTLDELRVYDRGLSAAEIRRLGNTADNQFPQASGVLIYANDGSVDSTISQQVRLEFSATDDFELSDYFVTDNATLAATAPDSSWSWIPLTYPDNTTHSENFTLSFVTTNQVKTTTLWLRDKAGNISDAVADTIYFDGALEMQTQSVQNAAANVSPYHGFSFEYNRPLDDDSFAGLDASLKLDNTTPVSGFWGYDGTTVRFYPSSPLLENRDYTVNLGTVNYSFTTGTVIVGASSTTTGTTWTFTNEDGTGRTGPKSTSVANTTISNGIQTWTVPDTGTYTIEAWGAAGGQSTYSGTKTAGFGAKLKGTFSLNTGDKLKIVVGQQPADLSGSSNFATGGGGGSFITYSDNTPLIIAGGGGGIRGSSASSYAHASISESGKSSNDGGSGGLRGAGGNSREPTGGGSGGPGGGLLSNGQSPGTCSSDSYGLAFVNGAQGGNLGTPFTSGVASEGGFGGGGAGNWCYRGTPGGGGGYSGGGAGINNSQGGGGGSYNAGTNPEIIGYDTTGNTGQGLVTIVQLEAASINTEDALLAHYPLDNNTLDDSGQAHHATDNGSPAATQDRFANPASALQLDGSTQYLAVAKDSSTWLPTDDNMSIQLVASSDNWTTACSSSVKGLVSSGTGLELLCANGNITPYLNGTATSATVATSSLSAGWHQLVVTYNGNTVRLYVDGASVADATTSGVLSQNTGYLFFGAQGDNGTTPVAGSYFAGALDDIYIYDRALNSSEVKALYSVHDVLPPRLVSSIPADNSIQLPVTANLTATFREPLDPATVDETTVVLRLDRDNSTVAGSVTYDNFTITFDPSDNLTGWDNYTLTFYDNITDLKGNVLKSTHGDNLTVRFKTAPVGAGIAGDPFQLDNITGLLPIYDNLSAHYLLTQNITLSGEWTPIGASGGTDNFSGHLNGDNFTISGLTITESHSYTGLFGLIGENATVKYLNVDVPSINAGANNNVGAIAGHIKPGAILQNISVTGGSIQSTGSYIGGLVGDNAGEIRESYSTATVSGGSYAGGIAGFNFSTATIVDSYSMGNVSGDNASGVVGENQGVVSHTYSTGVISGGTNLGGLIAINSGTVTYSYWDNQTSGQSTSAGSGSDNASARTTAQLQQTIVAGGSVDGVLTYESGTGWDNASVWSLTNRFDYPRLAWQFHADNVSFSPSLDNGTAVEPDDNITIAFNEAVDNTTFAGNLVLTLNDNSSSVAFASSYDNATFTLTIDPQEYLADNGSYTLTLSNQIASAMRTSRGRYLPDNLTINFQALVIPYPNIDNLTVADNETGVSTTRDLLITFGSAIDNTTVDNTTVYLVDNSTSTNVDGSLSVSADNLTIQFTPASALSDNTTYTFVVTTGILQQGEVYPALAADKTATFTTSNLAGGLVAWYPFNGNGEDAIAGNTLVPQNGAALSLDRFGNANSAYSFDGTDDYMVSNANVGISGASPRTLVYWHKSSTTDYVTNNSHVVNWGANTTDQSFGVFIAANDDQIGFYGATNWIDSAQSITTNWEHWAVTYDGTTVRMYKNGELLSPTLNVNLSSPDSALFVGNRIYDTYHSSPTDWFQGSVDDIRIYNRPLSAGEIQDLYTDNSSVSVSLNQLGTDGQTVYLDLSAYDSDLINAYEISDNLTFAGNWTTITPVDNLSLTALTYTFATPLTAERPLYVRVRDALGNISLPTSINVGPMATVWVQATGNAFSSARHYLRMESFNDELWAMGGHTTGATTNEVYHSENGTNWNLATTSNVWSEREVFTSEVFKNKLWVIGGNTPDNNGDVAQNDVWSSSDGISWDNSSATDRWSARWRLSSVVFDGKLWVMGGYNNGRLDDVWYSSDGISWDNSGVTDHWLARESHASVVFDGKIWVMGGNTASGVVNDVWSSSDGVDWVEELASNPSASHWSPRWEHNVLVFDNQIWLIGGTNSGRLRDIWKSSDGINWTEVVADGNTDFAASCCFGAAVHGNRMVIAGGKDTAGQQVNDVWYTTGTGVIAFSMRDNKTNVSLNPELWAELAYPIDNMTADFQNSVYLETEAGIQITGTVSSGVRVGSKTPTVDNRTIWFTPDSALDNATKYRFVITPAVKDKSGNSILKQNRTLQFTTQE